MAQATTHTVWSRTHVIENKTSPLKRPLVGNAQGRQLGSKGRLNGTKESQEVAEKGEKRRAICIIVITRQPTMSVPGGKRPARKQVRPRCGMHAMIERSL